MNLYKDCYAINQISKNIIITENLIKPLSNKEKIKLERKEKKIMKDIEKYFKEMVENEISNK